ncbi:endonuclease VII domain-containing protein [Streptomyces sp. BHT-5-2]|uniref:endonuclease VII domain-containing protein n=1 Tax=Streptomyces sp. BHT-5-2 TaxID=2866715 RepID=UPI0021B0DF4E|nr:endonuclease VII domain-containing protein [Streptomyces sp. BHT-5-2]
MPGRTDGLIPLGVADALWVELTADSAVPTAPGAFTCSPARARVGYVLLGGHVVGTVRASGGRWSVPEVEVRRAAAELNAVGMDRQDLVRIGPFRGAPRQERNEETPLRWRQRIMGELRELGGPEQAARPEVGRPYPLAGIDWRQMLVEQTRDGSQRTWWLPRAAVRLLDMAEHAATQWVQAARTRQASAGAAVTEQPSRPRQARAVDGPQATSPQVPTAPPRPYDKELEGQLYSVLSRKPGISRKVAGWACAVCHTTPAAVLDHCHEHGYVRAPVCQSCNTQERPDHLYSNDIRVANRYTRLFHTDTDDWLRHWHRCPGCRARTTLPLPHLAAWTAHIACRSLRPTHRAPRGRTPCGVLRVSWTGSWQAPRSCLLTVAVDFCPSGEHRVLARVPYRDAVERFGAWLAETAPAVAAAAGPDRLDGLPARFRPVIADTSGEDQALF